MTQMTDQHSTSRARARVGMPEAVARTAARAIGAFPAGIARRLAGSGRDADGLTLDPNIALLLALGEQAVPGPEEHDVEAQREQLRVSTRLVSGQPICGVDVTACLVDGAAGDLTARVYSPDTHLIAPAPLLVWFHGGGWIAGDLDTHDQVCRYLARFGRIGVLSVDYRLAPEFAYPAAVEDALSSFAWARAHAVALGFDPEHVAVGGDSAGGNLAAVVSQVTRDQGGPTPVAQLLVYPATDMSTTYPSEELFATGYFLTKDAMDWYDQLYSGECDKSDPRISPLRHPDLSGLAPAYIVTAGFDPLRDEGEAYAMALRDANVPVVLRRESGQVHGFVNMTGIHAGARSELIAIAGGFAAMATAG